MKLGSILSTLGLVACLTLVGAPTASAQSEQDPSLTAKAACLQACFSQYTENLRACQEACWVCDFSLFGLCFSGHHNKDCMDDCQTAARDTLNACKAAC